MNGFWFPWSEGVNGNKPGEFVAAWRHVHDIFTAVGATNVDLGLVPERQHLRQTSPSSGRSTPGDRYVDWTCLDGFNWGKRRGSPGWLSFNKIYPPHLPADRQEDRARRKPMMIGEIASSDKGGSRRPGSRTCSARSATSYRKVRARHLVRRRRPRHQLADRDVLDKDRNAFKKGIGNRAYRPNLFGGISDPRSAPPAPG